MKTFKHILIPTDFSDTARDALHAAKDIARGTRCRLSLVHVIADVWRQPWTAEAGVDLTAFQREWREDAQKRLQSLVVEEDLSGAGVTTAVVAGPPHMAIVQYADEQRADLIVMGAHGHGPIQRFLLGSVAERVVRAAHCPVLTVPHVTLRAEREPEPRDEAVAVGAANVGPDRTTDDQC